MRAVRAHPAATALAVFVLLAVAQTWPLATSPAHLSRVDNGDDLLNTWAIAWVAHQLPRHPLHLFDANIFYPDRLTLGYSEAMIVQGVLALPVLALGGTPVLAYNLVLLAGFVFTGWAFCLLAHRWTGSWSAGYVAGSAAAFNSHVLVRLPHLQTQHVEFVALMLFALDRLVLGRRLHDALLLGAAFALQGLTSVYLLVFSSWTMVFAVAARAREWLTRRPLRMIGLFAIALGTAVLLMAPYLYSYAELHRISGWERGAADQFPASWQDYLTTGSRIHYPLWSYRFMPETASATFPGLIATALVVLAFVWPETRRDPRARMCAVVALGCAAVSFAARLPFYPLLHQAIPLFRAVRVPAHLGQFVLLMIALLAGFGVSGLQRRWAGRRAWAAVAVALCAAVNVEALRAPIGWTPYTRIPAVYDALAHERRAVVIELPFYPPRQFFGNGLYMLNSTRYWHPLLNGYSGFRPGWYAQVYEETLAFPDDLSVAALHARGVTHVVVHMRDFVGLFGQARFGAIARSPALQRLAGDDDIDIYRVK